jgi:hypothetical protein
MGRRSRGVDEAHVGLAVLDVIREDIDERVADLARRREVAAVVAVAPDVAAFACEQAVHAERDADREAAHAVRELGVVVGLDDDVEVIGLDRIVDDAEAVAARAAGVLDRAAQHAMESLASKAGKTLRATQGDVNGLVVPVNGPRAMGYGRTLPARAARTGAATAPRRHLGERELRRCS